ncbi:MAG: integration host factor subunit alpha [Desulfobacteraceae bacterium]|nr:integration host factor subunit alpha [Desulfobacteraceae bacterium]MBT4364099.1 integration host factor subunit alpha [Desulfobacteraceae bacterium]
MTLTKAQIVEVIQNQLSFPKNQSTEIIETMLEIMKRSLETGEDVLISGFGKFCLREKSKRKGRNPATGEDMILDERRVITFNCSDILKRRINGEKK